MDHCDAHIFTYLAAGSVVRRNHLAVCLVRKWDLGLLPVEKAAQIQNVNMVSGPGLTGTECSPLVVGVAVGPPHGLVFEQPQTGTPKLGLLKKVSVKLKLNLQIRNRGQDLTKGKAK